MDSGAIALFIFLIVLIIILVVVEAFILYGSFSRMEKTVDNTMKDINSTYKTMQEVAEEIAFRKVS